MKETTLQVDLSTYGEEDWEILWEKLLTQNFFPERINSVESQRDYAYNYANSMIQFLKEKAAEQNNQDNIEE